LVGKADGKRSFGRPRHGWEGNIRMDVGKTWWKDVDLINVAHGRHK
jgi:hypothetical protein